MIRFRHKNFGLPALGAIVNGLMTGGMLVQGGMQMKQASDQAKEAEEQNEKMLAAQKRENAKLTKALNNIAEQAKSNPQAATQAGQLVAQSKTFAAPAKFITKGGKLVKDMISAAGGTGKAGKAVLGLGSAGLATGLTSYAIDKAQTADARKIGMMPPRRENLQQRSYAAPSVLSKVGNYAKKSGKYLVSKDNLKKSAGWAAIGALPVAGYLGDRAQFKGQQREQENIASQPQQRSYAAFNLGSMAKSARGYIKNMNPKTIAQNAKGYVKNMNPKTWQITKTPGQTLSGFAAKSGSMFMIGRKEVQKFGENLAKNPNMGSWARKTGNFIKENPIKSNLAVGLGAGSVLTGAYGAGEKIVKKTAKAVDKDAYAYEKFKNQQVQ